MKRLFMAVSFLALLTVGFMAQADQAYCICDDCLGYDLFGPYSSERSKRLGVRWTIDAQRRGRSCGTTLWDFKWTGSNGDTPEETYNLVRTGYTVTGTLAQPTGESFIGRYSGSGFFVSGNHTFGGGGVFTWYLRPPSTRDDGRRFTR